MSVNPSQKKGKRSRTSSNETHFSHSFVKSVTSRMSGLLPSTITNWFSSPGSGSNGSVPTTTEASDSSSEDEAAVETSVIQPPMKRMRYANSSAEHFQFDVPDTQFLSEDRVKAVKESVEDSFEVVQNPPGCETFRKETIFVSTPLRLPAKESTVTSETENDSSQFKSQLTATEIGRSAERKRKSLFGNDRQSQESSLQACTKTANNTMRNPNQPYFKASLLGSPFYPGHTSYGGASAHYLKKPTVKKVAEADNDSSYNNNISYTARKVMDLLESYSTPLPEMRRIPPYTKPKYDVASSKSSDNISSLDSRIDAYNANKTRELHVPGIASMLRLKCNRLSKSTAAARQLLASRSSTSDITYNTQPNETFQPELPDQSNKFTTKVKSRLTRTVRDKTDHENEMLPPVNLPAGGLQIDSNNLPQFNFRTQPTSIYTSTPFPKSQTTRTLPVTHTITSQNVPKLDTISNPEISDTNMFRFSSPTKISREEPEAESHIRFAFGSPDRNVVIKENNTEKAIDTTPDAKSTIESDKPKEWKCSDCWVNNKPNVEKCVCCGGARIQAKVAELVQCSVCKFAKAQPSKTKCANCDKAPVNNLMPLVSKPTDTSKWKCEDCWISNKIEDDKCAACGGSKPGTKKQLPTNTFSFGVPSSAGSKSVNDKPINNIASSSESKSKAQAAADSDWRCSDCWITNKPEIDKCVACGGANPNKSKNVSNKASSNKPPKSHDFINDIVKSQSSKWECDKCLVRNENDTVNCVCCGLPKSGSEEETTAKPTFKFGIENSKFKFGIEPSKKTESAKVPELSSEILVKKTESETNNNVLPKTPSFSFGTVSKAASSPAISNTDVMDGHKPGGFSFGIPKSVADVTVATATSKTTPTFSPTLSKPSAPTSEAKRAEKETEQEVPKMSLPVETPKTTLGIFAPPITPVQPVKETTVTSTPLTSSSVPEIKAPISTKPATSSEPAQPSATFTFGTGGIRMNPNLFAPPATPAPGTQVLPMSQPPAAASTVGSSMFRMNDVSTTATVSLFKKSDPVTTTATVSLFQKSIPAATTAAPVAATAPVFSFGTGTPAVINQPEAKPKFNFSFNNKTESMFNPTFPSAGDNKSFSLPTNASTNFNVLSSPSNNMGSGAFNATSPKNENAWPTPNPSATNMFSSQTVTNPPKPAAFSFGSSTSFNPSVPPPAFGTSAPNTVPAFGSSTLNNTPTFGLNTASPTPAFANNASGNVPTFNSNAPNSTPAFGSNTTTSGFGSPITGAAFGSTNQTSGFGAPQPNSTPFGTQSNMFGMSNQNASNSMFSSPASSGPVFGNAAPSGGMFGAANKTATPAFASNAPAMPSFEPTQTSAPAYNFGSPPPTGMFNFGQQQASVYNFGASPGAAGPVQFNMGTGSTGAVQNKSVRKIFKAARRTTPR